MVVLIYLQLDNIFVCIQIYHETFHNCIDYIKDGRAHLFKA